MLLKIRLCFKIWLPEAISVLNKKSVFTPVPHTTQNCMTETYSNSSLEFLLQYFSSLSSRNISESVCITRQKMIQAPQNKQELQFQPGINVWSTGGQQAHPPAGLSPARKNRTTTLQDRGNILYKVTGWMPEPLGFFQKCKWALLCKDYRFSTACE